MAQKIQFKEKDLAVISEAVKLSAQETDEKIRATSKNFQWWIAAIVLVCVLGFLQLLVAYFQFSSATYKEYSQKSEAIDTVQKTNDALLKQIQDLSQQNKDELETMKQLLKK